MRARWEFYLDCTGVRFERVHNFEAEISEEHGVAFGLPKQAFKTMISIIPDEECRDPLCEQTGKLTVTLPGDNEKTKKLASWLAGQVVQEITFAQGEVRKNYNCCCGKH